MSCTAQHEIYKALPLSSIPPIFGDLGIVGLLLIRTNQNIADIDSFIMSCRAMGRGVEIAILNWLKDYYLNQLGLASITSKYIPTKKNLPIKVLFSQQDFLLVQEIENEYVYEFSTGKEIHAKCDWINFTAKV